MANTVEAAIPEPTIEDMLLAVARAQGVLARGAAAVMKQDTSDGLLVSKWLEAHYHLYLKIAEECEDSLGVGDEQINEANKLANLDH
jgi:hypothetical protein